MRKRLREALLESLAPARLRRPIPDALAPPVGRLLNDRYRLGSCMAGTATSSKVCQLGDTAAHRRVVVFGDSHAEMWMPAFVQFAIRYHWTLVPLIKDGCVPSVMDSNGGCATWYRWALEQVRRLRPRAVVISQFWSSWGPGGVVAVERELRDLAPLAHRLAIVEDPPARPQAAVDCLLARGATLGSCTFRVTADEWAAYSSLQREAKAAGIGYVRTVQWFCARSLSPTVIGTIITYRDQTHVTATYARILAIPFAADVAVAIRG